MIHAIGDRVPDTKNAAFIAWNAEVSGDVILGTMQRFGFPLFCAEMWRPFKWETVPIFKTELSFMEIIMSLR